MERAGRASNYAKSPRAAHSSTRNADLGSELASYRRVTVAAAAAISGGVSSQASIAVSDKRIFVRSDKNLFCIVAR